MTISKIVVVLMLLGLSAAIPVLKSPSQRDRASANQGSVTSRVEADLNSNDPNEEAATDIVKRDHPFALDFPELDDKDADKYANAKDDDEADGDDFEAKMDAEHKGEESEGAGGDEDEDSDEDDDDFPIGEGEGDDEDEEDAGEDEEEGGEGAEEEATPTEDDSDELKRAQNDAFGKGQDGLGEEEEEDADGKKKLQDAENLIHAVKGQQAQEGDADDEEENGGDDDDDFSADMKLDAQEKAASANVLKEGVEEDELPPLPQTGAAGSVTATVAAHAAAANADADANDPNLLSENEEYHFAAAANYVN